jgi:hypothetical protein
MSYIAKTPVTVHLDDKRITIQPGQPLPELDPADIAELTRLKAIEAAPDKAKADGAPETGKAEAGKKEAKK